MTHSEYPTSDDVHRALKAWHRDDTVGSGLEQLLQFRRLIAEGFTPRRASNQLLYDALERLLDEQPELGRILRLHFLDQVPMYRVAHQLNRGESTLYPRQRAALARLAEMLREGERAERERRLTLVEARLPPRSATPLFGVDILLDDLVERLSAPGPPWIFSLEGMGGIGKTTLAAAVARRLITAGEIGDAGWVSAQGRRFLPSRGIVAVEEPALTVEALVERLADQLLRDPHESAPLPPDEALAALRERTRRDPMLLVVDNLETIEDAERLLPTLRSLVDPTRVLLTSRESEYGEADLFHLAVPQLSEPRSLELVRELARLGNQPLLAGADDAELRPIYERVGGNPLALRLVVGQTHIHGLDAVLDSLLVPHGMSEELYVYIFRRAWEHMDEVARDVWLATPLLLPGGDGLEDLAAIVGRPRGEVSDALGRLVRQNLVDVGGTLARRRYAIHNLTRSFLHEEVARWRR